MRVQIVRDALNLHPHIRNPKELLLLPVHVFALYGIIPKLTRHG